MNTNKRQARIAGALYLLSAIIGPIGLMYVPNTIVVSGNATATADHVRNLPSLLRLGIISEVVSSVVFIFVVLALYHLFKPVNAKHALAMLILLFVSIPISLFNVLNEIAALFFVGGDSFLSVFGKDQLDALAYAFIRLHGQGIVVASIFWGLWLFPFGILVMRSGFIPRALGYLLLVAGFAYVTGAFASLFFPGPAHVVVNQVAIIFEAGELPIIFWLLIWGTRDSTKFAAGTTSLGHAT